MKECGAMICPMEKAIRNGLVFHNTKVNLLMVGNKERVFIRNLVSISIEDALTMIYLFLKEVCIWKMEKAIKENGEMENTRVKVFIVGLMGLYTKESF